VINSFLRNKRNPSFEKYLTFLLLVGDIFLFILSDFSAFTLKFEKEITQLPYYNLSAYFRIFLFIIIIRLIFFYTFGLYYNLKVKTNFEIIVSTFKATFLSFLTTVVIAFYFRALTYPRSVIVISCVGIFLLTIIWRIFLKTIVGIVFGEDFLNSKVLILGINEEAKRLALHISKDSSTRYKVIGFVKTDNSENLEDDSVKILGNLESFSKVIRENFPDEVIITADIPQDKLINILSEISYNRISCKVLPHLYEAIMSNVITLPIKDINPVFVVPLDERFYWYKGAKRLIDILVSSLGLIIFSPLMLLIALLIKITSKGPVLFKQERIGLYGKRFILYKFRTMYVDAEEKTGPVWASDNDIRVTPLGRFLRKTRLDELPQLFNVFKNDMSLVGPRPERPYFVEILKEKVPFYLERLTVKPGITGWAQINYPYADSIETSKEKFLYDIYYIKNMSLALDLFIFIKTIWIILQEKGAH